MNIYLKSAVQNLDAHITALQGIRNQLASGIDAPVVGVEVFKPVQTPEWRLAEAQANMRKFRKHRRKVLRKQRAAQRSTPTK